MLNPCLMSRVKADCFNYRLDKAACELALYGNSQIETFPERRLQNVFGAEIWGKLHALGVSSDGLRSCNVLDFCCGTGFLSYHLLKRIPGMRLDLIDVSSSEVARAEVLIRSCSESKRVRFLTGDALSFPYDKQYDVILGNSFLHHFSDVPEALRKIRLLLKPGGLFVSLHEPTLCALGWESGDMAAAINIFLRGEKAVEPAGGDSFCGFSQFTDVWVFTAKDIRRLLLQAGFDSVKLANSGLFRPYIVAKKHFHLSHDKFLLSELEERMLQGAIVLDNFVADWLPSSLFGACYFSGRA